MPKDHFSKTTLACDAVGVVSLVLIHRAAWKPSGCVVVLFTHRPRRFRHRFVQGVTPQWKI
eukprot:3185946-Pleurochrysis_carterae.AAC.1